MLYRDTIVKILRSFVTVAVPNRARQVYEELFEGSGQGVFGCVYASLTVSHRVVVAHLFVLLFQEDFRVGMASNSQSMDVDKRGCCRIGELRALSVERGCYVSVKLPFFSFILSNVEAPACVSLSGSLTALCAYIFDNFFPTMVAYYTSLCPLLS